MKKGLTALVAVAAIGATVAVSMSNADAYRRYYYRGGGYGPGVAAGIIGGLAAGAIIAGATAPRYYGPGYAPAYGPGYAPAYAAPPPGCVQQQWVWSPRRGDYVMRNVRVPC